MKWEYKIDWFNKDILESYEYQRQLNSLGDEGWELAAVFGLDKHVFKRPKQRE